MRNECRGRLAPSAARTRQLRRPDARWAARAARCRPRPVRAGRGARGRLPAQLGCRPRPAAPASRRYSSVPRPSTCTWVAPNRWWQPPPRAASKRTLGVDGRARRRIIDGRQQRACVLVIGAAFDRQRALCRGRRAQRQGQQHARQARAAARAAPAPAPIGLVLAKPRQTGKGEHHAIERAFAAARFAQAAQAGVDVAAQFAHLTRGGPALARRGSARSRNAGTKPGAGAMNCRCAGARRWPVARARRPRISRCRADSRAAVRPPAAVPAGRSRLRSL